MLSYGTKKYLLDNGFKETDPWTEFNHENGLRIIFDEHEWGIEDVNDNWAEEGSLNNLDVLYEIIDDYKKK